MDDDKIMIDIIEEIEVNKVELYHGDCIQVMKNLIKQGVRVDCIIADIPQEITQNEWDMGIPFKDMWDCLYKIRRDKTTPIILFTNQPFTSRLICSNLKDFKIMKYWQKDRPSGFLNAKRMPLKDIEEIAIFYEKQCTYNPQMWKGKPLHGMGKKFKEEKNKNNNYGDFDSTKNPSANRKGDTTKYPRQLLVYPRPHPPIHPTEKNVDLMRDLIRTYSNKNDVVLDFTMGSGTTGFASLLEGRRFIGIEKEEDYMEIACQRIKEME